MARHERVNIMLDLLLNVCCSGRQQMSLQIDASDVDYEILREREDALLQLEVIRFLFVAVFLHFCCSGLSLGL